MEWIPLRLLRLLEHLAVLKRMINTLPRDGIFSITLPDHMCLARCIWCTYWKEANISLSNIKNTQVMSDAVGVIWCFSRKSTNTAEHHIMCANNPGAPDRLSGPGGTWHIIRFKIPLVLQIGERYLSLTAILIMSRWWTISLREMAFENF